MKDQWAVPVAIGTTMAIVGIMVIIAAAWKLSVSRNVALTVIFMMSIVGPSLVFAANAFSSIEALGRNPSAAPKIMTAMVINLFFSAGVTIVAFLVVWQLYAARG
ncbi:MAG: hypothetical protein HY737_08835 [Candidatus Omnitrophica bacterium]|nr:hypothetical protein [Candidatus Omnitrophota bacterium]